jgi:glycosyltransferase involved in cell wall biosynthesis
MGDMEETSGQPGMSIVIAAHNEAAVIEGTLWSILRNRIDRPLEIVVVANGCTDDTASRARRMQVETGPRDATIEVIETPVGNKINALNLGDQAAKYFPRAFVDADCEVSEDLLMGVLEAFKDPRVRIVAPGVKYVYRGWNPVLAGYYRLWQSLPYVRRDTMARGFYAMDRELRGRFEEFPRLTADDKFIRNLTRPEERRVVEKGFTTVYLPATFSELLKVKTRWTYGNLELAQSRPDLNVNDRGQHEGAMGYVLRRPWHWPSLPTFMFVYGYAHRAARKRLMGKGNAWERAESSRGEARGVA